MQNTYENKAFLLAQIESFLSRFPIGMVDENLVYQDVNEILEFYIQLLQDCIYKGGVK